MDDKLEKVLRLWKGNPNLHEQDNARRMAERIAARLGMTFDQAVAQLEALDGKPSGRTGESQKPRETPEQARRRRERAARRAEIIARYGSVKAVLTPTEAERAVMDALNRWRIADPDTGETIWLDGLRFDGSIEFCVADVLIAAVRKAFPWPRSYADALAEDAMWERRNNDLRCVKDDGASWGLDMAVQVRVLAIRDLIESEMPASTIADVSDRLWRYRAAGSTGKKEMLDAIERDLAAFAKAEKDKAASVKPVDSPLDAALKANPDLSDREIARRVGVSPPTVGKARRRLGLDITERSVERGSQIFKMRNKRSAAP